MQNKWIERLEYFASVQPDKVIFKEAGKEGLTYSRFLGKVSDVARILSEAFDGNIPTEPIAVSVERNVASLVAVFGVIAAGGWYVPIDAGLPQERAKILLDVCKPAAILCSSPEDNFDFSNIKQIKVEPDESCSFRDFKDRDGALPMFGIFTSGSTGIPKLVVKDGIGIWEFITSYCNIFEFGPDERFGNQIPFYFDASTKDVFATVYLGATTVIFPQKAFSFPMNLIQLLDEEKITSFVCVPSVMSVTAQYDVFSALKPGALKNVLFVGERMPVKSLNYWRDSLTDCRFVNLYGSTEVAGNSCYYIIDRDFSNDDILPIGHPFDTARIFLLDESGQEADEGEICVTGAGVALGYYQDKEKTDAVFKEVQIGSFSGRVYFSGDFGKKNERGEYVCITRKDSQIKHIGHRIELGDIEACVSGLDYVYECCCLYSKEDEAIVLICACDEQYKKNIRKDLKDKLPKYMLPQQYICLPKLPHNRNGKIDRAELNKCWREL